MRRKPGVPLAGLLAALAARSALAQTGAPPVQVAPPYSLLINVLRWATYFSVVIIAMHVYLKLRYGFALTARATPAEAAPSSSRKLYTRASILFFAIMLVLTPLLTYIVAAAGAAAGLLPEWVAAEIGSIVRDIWTKPPWCL